MSVRPFLAAAFVFLSVLAAHAQQAPAPAPAGGTQPAGRDSSTATFVSPSPVAGTASASQPQAPAKAADAPPRRPITRVTTGTGALPNESGQLYREYDVSPYTARITTTKRP